MNNSSSQGDIFRTAITSLGTYSFTGVGSCTSAEGVSSGQVLGGYYEYPVSANGQQAIEEDMVSGNPDIFSNGCVSQH